MCSKFLIYLGFERVAIINIFSFVYIKVTRTSSLVSVYHKSLNFAITPVPATCAWLKTHFRSTSNLLEGHQKKRPFAWTLSVCQSSQSFLLLNICVFTSNFSLSVCSSQTLALMPFSSEERTPSLSKATDSSLLSRWAM